MRCPSVTPVEGGALDVCESFLKVGGFQTWRLPFAEVDNLFARFGKGGPHLCFAGHVDVVPVGDETHWKHPPFEGVIEGGCLYGRGAEDMKANIAAAMSAAVDFLSKTPDYKGSISFLLTGDEEGPAVNGTAKVLDWMSKNEQLPDKCVVIEPTAKSIPGDTLKVGRRGSINGQLIVKGVQGHAAYPSKAQNPLPGLVQLLGALVENPLDTGTEHFEPSSLQITTIDVGNEAQNVIPSQGQANFNSRFNDLWTPESVEAEIRSRLDKVGVGYELRTSCNAVAFMTPLEKLAAPLADALEAATGKRPQFSTEGGTSDARFVQAFCPVVEMGLVCKTLHQVDEHVPTKDITELERLYRAVIQALAA